MLNDGNFPATPHHRTDGLEGALRPSQSGPDSPAVKFPPSAVLLQQVIDSLPPDGYPKPAILHPSPASSPPKTPPPAIDLKMTALLKMVDQYAKRLK